MTIEVKPRLGPEERLRHGHRDKFAYIRQKTRMFGCGRCSWACLGDVDRWAILKEAIERKKRA